MNHKLENLVVIGASAGGLKALKQVLCAIPKDFSVPVLVVQHMMATGKRDPCAMLGCDCQLKIEYAVNGKEPEPGHVYFAPPDYHLRINEAGVMMISSDEPVNYSRPSIDVLFDSAASLNATQVVAITLTGMNSDGAKGAKNIQNNGGRIIVQDPRSAEYSRMPEAVINEVDNEEIIWLDQIGPVLWDLFRRKHTHNIY